METKKFAGSVAAITTSIGALSTPAAAQSYSPPHKSNQTQVQAPNNGNQPSGDPCCSLVVAGGIVAAGGALALRRSKSDTERQLLEDDREAREWEHWHGRR